MAKPQNITELRDALLDTFDEVKNDPKRANQAKETANVAGKIIGTVKAQLEYALMRGEEPDIPFLGKTSGRQIGPTMKALKKGVRDLEG